MTKIYIAADTPAAAIKKIKALLKAEALNNPHWNGANFRVVMDDFTWAEDESADALELMNMIKDIISGY